VLISVTTGGAASGAGSVWLAPCVCMDTRVFFFPSLFFPSASLFPFFFVSFSFYFLFYFIFLSSLIQLSMRTR
jgi:hypothetical protein